jgi:hypothetical protein
MSLFRLKESQLGQTLAEEQVMEQGTCLSHHSLGIVCKLTCCLEQNLIYKCAIIKEIIAVREPR